MKSMKKAAVMTMFLAFFFLGSMVTATAVEVGQKAPDFELDSTKGGKLKLSSLLGKNVLINVYVLDFSPT